MKPPVGTLGRALPGKHARRIFAEPTVRIHAARIRITAGQVLLLQEGELLTPVRKIRCRDFRNFLPAQRFAIVFATDHPQLPRELVHEMAGQFRDVADPFLQKRHVDVHHVDPVVEVGAEPALGDRAFQIGVAGVDEPQVEGDLPLRSGRADAVVLDHAQQRGLHRHRQFRDLVEEKRAAGRHARTARLGSLPRSRRTVHGQDCRAISARS